MSCVFFLKCEVTSELGPKLMFVSGLGKSDLHPALRLVNLLWGQGQGTPFLGAQRSPLTHQGQASDDSGEFLGSSIPFRLGSPICSARPEHSSSWRPHEGSCPQSPASSLPPNWLGHVRCASCCQESVSVKMPSSRTVTPESVCLLSPDYSKVSTHFKTTISLWES